MKKRVLFCLLSLLAALLFSACAGEGSPEPYQIEHEHSFGASHDIAPEDGGEVTEQVRYCKICHQEQIHPKQ
jgi:hypothetical protein